jgi:hypothetical protein
MVEYVLPDVAQVLVAAATGLAVAAMILAPGLPGCMKAVAIEFDC